MKKRIFAAIDISDEAREKVAAYITGLRTKFTDAHVKWEKPEKLHITLKFMGSIDERGFAALTTRVAAASAETARFTIGFTGTGAFTRRSGQTGVLWIGLDSYGQGGSNGILKYLAALFDDQATRSPGTFKPHLTIARIRDGRDARRLVAHHLASILDPIHLRRPGWLFTRAGCCRTVRCIK